jgi:hypothetical protein
MTQRRLNSIKSGVRLPGSPGETYEHLYLAMNGGSTFGLSGDSGSWVLDSLGRLVGLLLAGQEATNHCYVTPISVVIEDIETSLGCKVTYQTRAATS